MERLAQLPPMLPVQPPFFVSLFPVVLSSLPPQTWQHTAHPPVEHDAPLFLLDTVVNEEALPLFINLFTNEFEGLDDLAWSGEL